MFLDFKYIIMAVFMSHCVWVFTKYYLVNNVHWTFFEPLVSPDLPMAIAFFIYIWIIATTKKAHSKMLENLSQILHHKFICVWLDHQQIQLITNFCIKVLKKAFSSHIMDKAFYLRFFCFYLILLYNLVLQQKKILDS